MSGIFQHSNSPFSLRQDELNEIASLIATVEAIFNPLNPPDLTKNQCQGICLLLSGCEDSLRAIADAVTTEFMAKKDDGNTSSGSLPPTARAAE